jgi:hypothetical protein
MSLHRACRNIYVYGIGARAGRDIDARLSCAKRRAPPRYTRTFRSKVCCGNSLTEDRVEDAIKVVVKPRHRRWDRGG